MSTSSQDFRTLIEFIEACKKMSIEAVNDKPNISRPPVFMALLSDGRIAALQTSYDNHNIKGMNNIARRLFSKTPTVMAMAVIEGVMWRGKGINEQTAMQLTLMTNKFLIIKQVWAYDTEGPNVHWWENTSELNKENSDWLNYPFVTLKAGVKDGTITKTDNLLKSLLFGYLFYKLLHSLEAHFNKSSVAKK